MSRQAKHYVQDPQCPLCLKLDANGNDSVDKEIAKKEVTKNAKR